MSRYIDAEWLKSRVHYVPLANGAIHGCVDKLDLIDAPTIDIVRCKECVERDDDWCMYWGNVINVYDFCSYGEREGE